MQDQTFVISIVRSVRFPVNTYYEYVRFDTPHSRELVISLMDLIDYRMFPLDFIQAHENDKRLALMASRQDMDNMYIFDPFFCMNMTFLSLVCPNKVCWKILLTIFFCAVFYDCLRLLMQDGHLPPSSQGARLLMIRASSPTCTDESMGILSTIPRDILLLNILKQVVVDTVFVY